MTHVVVAAGDGQTIVRGNAGFEREVIGLEGRAEVSAYAEHFGLCSVAFHTGAYQVFGFGNFDGLLDKLLAFDHVHKLVGF